MATPRRELGDMLSIARTSGLALWPVPEWSADATCAQVDPELFYPEKGGSTRAAKRICSTCPVREECLEWALAYESGQRGIRHGDGGHMAYGIYGGLAPQERRKLLRERLQDAS